MPVVDSSPLIYLAEVEKLSLLKELYGSLKIPPAVYREVVVRGKEKGFEDALRVEAEIGKFLFVCNPERAVVDVKEHLKKLNFRLGAGEIECVALCMETNDKVLLTDDDDAKRFARTYGIDARGTIYLLLKSHKEGLLSRKECIVSFETIVRKGFWVNSEVVNVFYRILDRIEK